MTKEHEKTLRNMVRDMPGTMNDARSLLAEIDRLRRVVRAAERWAKDSTDWSYNQLLYHAVAAYRKGKK